MYVLGKLFGRICHLLLAGESLLKKDMHAAMDKTRQHTGRRKGEKIELLSLMPLCYPLPTRITFFWIQKRNIIHSSYIVLCCAKSLQSCWTLWDSIDCNPLGSSVQGILQAKILEWVSKSSSRRSSWSRNRTLISCVSCIGRWILYHWATGKPPAM